MVYTTLFYLILVAFSDQVKFNKGWFFFAILIDLLSYYG
jgi:hypothetical protein